MSLVSRIAAGIALIAALYHVYFAFDRPFTEGRHAIVHVGFAAVIVALDQARRRAGGLRLLALVCLAISVAASIYFFAITDDLEMRFGIGLTTPEIVAGIAIIAVVIALCWMEWGAVIALLAVVGLMYFFFGSNIPGPLKAAANPSFEYAMTFLISAGGSGLYGQITPISADIIFLFMLFGALLGSTGVTRLFMELGNYMGRLLQGGAAVTCVVSSALLGTVTGATVANVAIVGAFTIPTMKRQGFRAADAAAVEAVASCGGQVLPPVMGAGAFIMASYLGINYIEIAAHALVGALMFFASVLVAIIFLVRKVGKVGKGDDADLTVIRNELIPFLVPLGVLVYFLTQSYSATTSVVYAIISVIAVHFLRPRTWRSREGLVSAVRAMGGGLISGAQQGASLAIVTATISLVAQVLITTALGPKFASALAGMAGDQTFIALTVVMFASLLLGCGLPTVAAYTVVAIMMVPALHRLGVDPMAAHLFVFYFAVYAAVTPPVATAAIVASRIAETSFWSTARSAMRLMVGPIILPFLFIYRPAIIQFPPDPLALALPVLGWLVATVALLTVTMRHCITPATTFECGLSAVAGGLACAWIVVDIQPFLWVAISLMLIVMTLQYQRRPSPALANS